MSDDDGDHQEHHEPQEHDHEAASHHHHYTTAADAAFLEQMTVDPAAASAMSANSSTQHSHLQELHQSNLLRLQTDELLQESMLHLVAPEISGSSGGAAAAAAKVVKWAPFAHDYLQHVSSIIQEEVSLESLGGTSSSSSLSFPTERKVNKSHKKTDTVVTVVDTPARLMVASTNSNSNSSLLGLTTLAGNAQVLPTLAMHVQIPSEGVFEYTKDYLRHRYFQKRNLIAWHVAQHLAQAKYAATVGEVYWKWANVDQRQVVLVLIPPCTKNSGSTTTVETNKKNKKAKKGSKLQQQDVVVDPFTANSLPKRVRFRVHVHFGMQSTDWIPPLRLVPNRCNLQHDSGSRHASDDKNTTTVLPLSQMYNQALTEDAIGFHVASAALSLSHHSHYDNDNDDDSMDEDKKQQQDESYPHWNAATILAKIWMLQRGLLNRHDGYTNGSSGSGEHLISIQILYLYRTRRVSPRLGPLQVLQAWFKLLAETNWLGDDHTGISHKNEKEDHDNLIRKAPSEAYRETAGSSGKQKRTVLVLPQYVGQGLQQTIAASSLARLYAQQTKESPLAANTDPPTLLELYQNTTWYRLGPVLLDSSMRFNFMGRIAPAFMRLLQREARKSLAVLQHDCHHPDGGGIRNNNQNDQLQHHVIQPFSYLFMKPVRFWNRHDAYLYIPLKEFDFEASTLWGTNSGRKSNTNNDKVIIDPMERHDYGDYETISRGLIKVLKMALGDRIRDVQLLSTGNGIVGIKEETTTRNDAASTDPTVMDSNEIPTFPVSVGGGAGTRSSGVTPLMKNKRALQSPTGSDMIVLGVTLNADTCHRIVDRGPPADDLDATKTFLELWGEKKAELRRFKDGAIVHAVVWGSTPTAEEQREEDDDNNAGRSPFIRFQNDDKVQGGIVERAIRHILRLHFLKKTTPTAKQPPIQFSLRSMMSTVDSVAPRGEGVLTFNPLAAHRMVLKAFDSLSDFLRKQSLPSVPVPGSTKLRSPLGIPLAIDAVEPLAPSLRYCELFPPIPHPSLGGAPLGNSTGKNKKLTGSILSDPILIQVRFGASSKWPNDLRAIGAAKTAMLVQLVSGIEQLRESKRGYTSDSDLIHAFDGPTVVSPGYADIGFMGFVFRILVRADPELKLLHSLTKPSPEAACLLRTLSRRHVVAAMHHSMVHSVYTSHPSSSAVVRLARRWVASHLLSGMIPFEAVELMVVHVYSDRASPLDSPGTVMMGFLRFLQVLAGHNWSREPLIVDPQGHLTEDDYNAIAADFETLREKASATSVVGIKANTIPSLHGPPMFIVSPCDRQHSDTDKRKDLNKKPLWTPTFTLETPEWVVLNRAAKLAHRSFVLLRRCLTSHPSSSAASSSSSLSAPNHQPSWPCVFQETMESFRAYSAIFRVHPDFIVDDESSSSTRNTTGTTDKSLVARRNTDGAWESSYTRSMDQRLNGPKDLRMKKLYKNLADSMHHEDDEENQSRNSSPLLLEWRPVDSMVENLRRRLGHSALFFYNDLCPEVVGVLWRPQLFVSKSFSAITSECVRPLVVATMPTIKGKAEDETSLVVVHASDLLREASAFTADVVMDQKVFYPPMLSSCDTATPEARKMQAASAAKSSSTTGRKRQLPAKEEDVDNEDE